jgi:aryl-alcohol dehydrogenase-like predicted oxidoreductase
MNPFSTGLIPSRIILGTGSFGSNIPREEAFAVMDAYLDAGGNVLDTAHIYSSWEPNGAGASERTVGEWIRSRNVRDRIILGTKGGHPDLCTMDRARCTLEDLRRDLSAGGVTSPYSAIRHCDGIGSSVIGGAWRDQ